MAIESKKDVLGKYKKISYENGRIEIIRFFKELGISVKVVEKYER